MSNSKISALTSATTPLAGTEVLPIVQSGATVNATVANITGAGTYPGSFTTLDSSGNTTLGDTTTDTVKVNGYMGVGVAAAPSISVYASSTALTTTNQRGFQSSVFGTSAATVKIAGYWSNIGTAATAFTCTDVINFYALNAIKGAGSTITNLHGLYIENQTQGTNNYGITSLVSSGANKWNIYASGTASNYLAGGLNVGATADPGAGNISLTGNVVIGTSGKGIDFSATAGTGTSELLADYEEGTWTPSVRGETTAGTYTISNAFAYYTKVGNQVTVYGSFGFSAASGGAGDIRIQGLPYNYKADPAAVGNVKTVSYNFTSANPSLSIIPNSALTSNRLTIFESVDNAAGQNAPITGVTTSTTIVFQITYTVA
jgi:hypothetical protein